ncbi:MAG: class II aldolase/adducin family protein [Bryobacterales bacterium]|nr:class II aldolase/adducin family protein [Bryobacterales bacterium]
MAKSERELREDIVRIGQLVYQKGWVASNDGNISIRLAPDRILCTPTGVSKGMMTVDDLIVVDPQGKKVEGARQATSEILMHLTIYSMRPDAVAVVHTHPPTATGFAAAGRALNQAILPEVVVNLGCIPLAAYGLPGTPALSDSIKPFVPKYDAILLANHGAVCYGADVWQAFFRMETLEHYARIALVAETLGGANLLPRGEVAKLIDARTRYGVKSKATGEPGCPVAAEDSGAGVAVAAAGEETFTVTRAELIALVEEAMRAAAGKA